MENHCVNRRHHRNLPGELKVEIVDCFPVENAVHFLANVPNRLIIRHCAPRVRRMFEKMINKIAADYARKLPAPDSDGDIFLHYGHNYTPEMDIFLRYGAAHSGDRFFILRGTIDGFVGYPANFFDDLIKHCNETKVPTKAVHHLNINLPLINPVPWPAALVQPQAGEMNVEELGVGNERKFAIYKLRNKHNPGIEFTFYICFEGEAKCYQQMTRFRMRRVEDVQSGEI